MTLIILMIIAMAALVWEKFGRLEAVITALGLAHVFSVVEVLD